MIPLGKPETPDEAVKSAIKVLRSANISNGNLLQKFEVNFSNYVGNDGTVVNSGIVASHMSNKKVDLKRIISFIRDTKSRGKTKLTASS